MFDMTKSPAVKRIAEKADYYGRCERQLSARHGELCAGTEAIRAALSNQALRKFLTILDEGGTVIEAEFQAKQLAQGGIIKWNEKHGFTAQIWEVSLHSMIEDAGRRIRAEGVT